MPSVMVYHEIKDKDHWLASPRREQLLAPLGVTNIRTFVDPENPTRVGFSGSTNFRMLVTPRGPKNSSRFGEASQ